MRRTGFTALIALLFSCAVFTTTTTTPTVKKNYQLTAISDPQPLEEHAVSVFINLQSDSGNTVAIFNWGKYRAFRIYRSETPTDTFALLGELNAGPVGSSLSLMPFFCDTRNNSLDNRYRVKPLENGDELDKLPVIYETTDGAYYKKIEKKKR